MMISRLLYLTKKQPAEQSHILQYLTEQEEEPSAAATGGNLRASVVFPSLRGDKKGLGGPRRDDGSRHLVGNGWCVKVFWILGWAAVKVRKVAGFSPISSPGAFLQLVQHHQPQRLVQPLLHENLLSVINSTNFCPLHPKQRRRFHHFALQPLYSLLWSNSWGGEAAM